MVVHEYDEVKGEAVVEIWRSDHEALPITHRTSAAKVAHVQTHKSVIGLVSSHPLSPTIICRLAVANAIVESVDEANKTFVQAGKKMSFKVLEKDNRGVQSLVVDEG